MKDLPKIKVGLVGVGNCASALVQGAQYYRNKSAQEFIGLKYTRLAGFSVKDIEFVCAFDVIAGKVGKDLSEALFVPPNNTTKFVEVPRLNVKVLKGPILDGVSEYTKGLVKIDDSSESDVAKNLEDSEADILINLLPGGAPEASQRYAEESIKAGCAFVNATPTLIASDAVWSKRFEKADLPVVGDDLMDQVGATFLHKVLLETLHGRGVRVCETYQLDVGGGTESAETQQRVWSTKRMIKTKSVESILPYKASVVAGSTDFVEFLGNRRDNYFWISGLYFGGIPFRMDIRLSSVDAPNAGSVLFDIIRSVKLALERKEIGNIIPISTYGFKNPTKTVPLLEAQALFENYTNKK